MQVTLLYFDGCPNWQAADRNLQMALDELGTTDLDVHRQPVLTVEDAERLRFAGSPTVLIDGVDPFAEPGAPVGFACRVYRSDAGLAGTPTVEQLHAALTAARPSPGPGARPDAGQ